MGDHEESKMDFEPAVKIRPWRREDAPALQALADHIDVARWMSGFPHPYTRNDAEEWTAKAALQHPPQFFAIEVDGVIVGGAGLEPRDGSHKGVVILGYWLGRAYWGRGIANAVVSMLVEHAFSSGFRRVEAHVFAPNAASLRVLEKCGFTLEGRLRASYVELDGTACDELIFGRIDTT